MVKLLKIILLVLLILLVFMALIADKPQISAIFHIMNFSFYVRIASILGLIIVVFTAWGYKRRIETSQKYRRADHIIAEAEATAQRHERNAMLIEEKLKTDFQQKTKVLKDRLAQLKAEHQHQLMALKTQNVQLKEEVSKLMRILKQKQAGNSDEAEPGSASEA